MSKRLKTILIVLFAFLLFAVAAFKILSYQSNTVFSQQESKYDACSDNVEASLIELSDEIQVLMDSYEQGLNEKAREIAILLETLDEQKAISDASEICDTDFIFMENEDGIILAAARESMLGRPFDEVVDENESAPDDDYFNNVVISLDDGRRLCYGEYISVFDEQIACLYEYGLTIGDIVPEGMAFTFLAYDNDGVPYILYYNHKGEVYSREPLSKIGVGEDALTDGFEGYADVCGEPYIISSRLVEAENLGEVYLVTAYQYNGPVSSTNRIVIWEVFLLAMCLAALVCYGCFLEKECTSKSRYFGKLVRISVLMVLLTFVISFYTQTLELISDAAAVSDYNALLLEQRLDVNEKTDSDISASYRTDKQAKMELAAACCNANPDLLKEGVEMTYRVETEDGMREDMKDAAGNAVISFANCPFVQRLTEVCNALEVSVFNKDGYTVSTNGDKWYYTLKDIGDDIGSQVCLDVLDGKEHFSYGVYNDYSLSTIGSDAGSIVMLENTEAIEFSKVAREKLVYKAAEASTGAKIELFVPAEDSAPESRSSFRINDSGRSFVQISQFEDGVRCVRTTFDTASLFKIRNLAVPVETAFCAAAFLLLIMFMTILFKPAENPVETTESTDIRGIYDFKKWAEMTAAEKLYSIISLLTFFVVLALGYVILKAKFSPKMTSAIGYIMTGDWTRGINFFSLASCGVAIFGAYALQLVIRTVIRFFTSDLPEYQRAKFNFISSFFAILLYVLAALCCLYYIGLDIKGLFASAGIMAAVIGVASKESIASIFRGASNIYFDRYRVGEFVEVDGFEGYITQMNLTGIVIEDLKGNIKTVSSSKLDGLVNQSRHDTIQKITVPVSPENEKETIDRIMAENLAELDKKFEGILTKPSRYSGLSGILSTYNREVGVVVTTTDEDSLSIKSKYCMELTELLKRNGVKFPVPYGSHRQT